jgi:1,2-diacylglycerol 3-alpha-glucosyltransferase
MTRRICVIWISLGPYHLARMNALTAYCGSNVYSLELSANEEMREWVLPPSEPKFERRILYNGSYETADMASLVPAVEQALDDIKPQVVIIAGYSERPMRAAASWAKRFNTVSILISDTHKQDRPRYKIKEYLKGWWIRRYYDAAFVGGSKHVAYLKGLGFSPDRTWIGYSVVDNQIFKVGAESSIRDEHYFRDKLGLPERYFLYVGRLSPEKNLRFLMKAYARYRGKLGEKSWSLVIVGSGPQLDDLRAAAKEIGLTHIIWPGFQQIDTLPIYYGLASCFILPSISEPWGLVVNEAMASGLPVLVSNRCGCVPELVQEGINGYGFDPQNMDKLVDLMINATTNQRDLKEMGLESRKKIEMYSPEAWAKSLSECIEVTIARKGTNILS